ncbi:hypothetical protein RRG08_045636 [Elysia crispata]|uniref:Uncharacterized protein n=1 Tax=Elysia crispata TaxID=231223 RepID=A0AAE0XYN1_9GAST|nr:hypothetical protein RRG08_045636 [Elysia crispata]
MLVVRYFGGTNKLEAEPECDGEPPCPVGRSVEYQLGDPKAGSNVVSLARRRAALFSKGSEAHIVLSGRATSDDTGIKGTRQHKRVEKLETVELSGCHRGIRQHEIREARDWELSRCHRGIRQNTGVWKLENVGTLGVSQRDKTARDSRS